MSAPLSARIAPLIFVLGLACTSTPAPTPSLTDPDLPGGGKADDTEPGAEAAPVLPLEIHWQRNSAEYEGITRQIYRLAAAGVEALAAEQAQDGGGQALPWAVALDVDETVLDNSLYQKERVGLGYSPPSWLEWVERREAPAVPGAAEFTQRVHELGGYVALVTNRLASKECAPTRENLAAAGVAFDVLLCKTETSEKEPRWQALEDGTATDTLPPVDILAYVGDAIGDFPDLDQDTRHAGAQGFEEMGRRFFLLPNPMYGSWEKNARE